MTPAMEKESRAEVRLLQSVTTEINATLDLETIFETVLRAMDELFGFRHSLILLLDPSGESLTVAASRGYEPKRLGARVPMGGGPIGVAAKRRRIVRMTNLGQQRSYFSAIRARMERAGRVEGLEPELDLPGLPDAESQIAIPLQIKDTLVGVFFVESRERRMFGEREESLVGIVANHAAAAIANARLYETLEERVRERTDELARKNRELRETQAQLLQSATLAALGDLVAGVAHDMGSPLGAIYANADLAERAAAMIRAEVSDQPRSERLEKALQAVERTAHTTRIASERILSIVKSLRSFARLDEAERKRVDLHEGIEAALGLLRHRLIGGIEVVRDYGSIPEVVVYPNRLNQAFMNLIVNAIDAMGAGGTLTIRTRLEDSEVVIEFEDTGRGVAESDRARVFDPGFTTKGVGVGLGLGLPTSYRIVQDHGGRLELESTPGKGTRVTVRIPAARA